MLTLHLVRWTARLRLDWWTRSVGWKKMREQDWNCGVGYGGGREKQAIDGDARVWRRTTMRRKMDAANATFCVYRSSCWMHAVNAVMDWIV